MSQTAQIVRPAGARDLHAADMFMPAETAPHLACWMAWPTRPDLWGDLFPAVKREYALVANTIARFEPVIMIANAADVAEARRHCADTVTIRPAAIDDSWMRDSGPTFLIGKGGGTVAINWKFNAWGGKYHPHARDASLTTQLAQDLGLATVETFLVAEGGAILSDGEGTIFTTESCLLNPNRNPGLDKITVERELLRCLNAQKVVWLPGDPSETETDGHIDGFLSIVRPGLVMLETAGSPDDPRHLILAENRRALLGQTDAKGRSFEIIEIGEAQGIDTEDPRYSRSYVNFYIANGAVIMPSYGTFTDAPARAAASIAFPDREIVQLRLDAIPYGGGSIHCITQQQPKTIR